MSVIIGLSACGIASLCFGSMYVPVKRAGDPGDEIVVQWLVCSAIFLSGFITYLFLGMPAFQPFAMLGGMLWALGNLTALPLIKILGIGLSTLIWGVVNCVVGWATGRFGLFGTKASIPTSPTMNYIGLVFVIVGGILFALVRPKVSQSDEVQQSSSIGTVSAEGEERNGEETVGLLANQQDFEQPAEVVTNDRVAQQGQRELLLKERLIALAFAIFAGACYGSLFTPVLYMQNNPDKFHPRPPDQGIYYVFSHFSGVYLTSTVVLCAYIAYKNNRPSFDTRLMLPALLAGLLWAIGTLCWFWANDLISQAITYPITVSGASAVCSLWSVIFFKEVEKEELKKFGLALIVTTFGVTLVGLSKAI